jgi:hypothetical protein
MNAKAINHTNPVNSTTNQHSINNISLFKNFITQYQSQSTANTTKTGSANNTHISAHLSKLDLNKITNTSVHGNNFPSSRGLNGNHSSMINNNAAHYHSTVDGEGRAASSMKTFDGGSRNGFTT